MCRNAFRPSGRPARLAQIEAERQASLRHQAQMRAEQERQSIMQQNLALQREQNEFQQQQMQAVESQMQRATALAARPTPGPAEDVGMVATGDTSYDDRGEFDPRRKGRRGLRIDLSAPQQAGATGLNVPRG